MPEKLPAPEDGTAEQAGPNGADAVCADWVGMAEAEDDDEDGVLDPELAEVPLEPHAAAPNARPADRTAMAGILYLIFSGLLRTSVMEHLGCGKSLGATSRSP
jgi:hypothetical protein